MDATVTTSDNFTVPVSCCLEPCDLIFGSGCIKRLEFVVGQSAITFATATLFIALLQVCLFTSVFTVFVCVSGCVLEIGPLFTITV